MRFLSLFLVGAVLMALGALPSQPQQVSFSVYDLSGRHVETSGSQFATATRTASFTLRSSRLAAGAYVLRVVGEQFSAARLVVVP